jgi:hypothetical protein
MQVIAFLTLEASQSNGRTYRLAIGWAIHPQVASMMALIVRLF